MKKLIIAEKPSQAREYANAIGGFSTRDGYFESEKSYITWCFGHLVEMARDTAYRGNGNWSKSYLPLLPQNYQYCIGTDSKGKTDKAKKKQLELIKKLASQSSEIINATDADREGELIFLYVYNFLNLKLPYRRLWISSLTKGDILKGFKNLLSADEVKNIGKSGYARAISDWLVGINGTQSATLQLGERNLLTVGRVQTTILKIICERYLKNKNFVPSYSYRIKALHQFNGIPYYSSTDVYESQEEAQNLLNYLDKEHLFKEVQKTKKKVSAPLLHSIDTLIIEANKTFGYSGQDTLAVAQSLYEKKLTTYPRTDSQYINEENYDRLQSYLPNIAQQVLSISFSFAPIKPKSVNAKKLTGSHDAIIPTGELTNLNGLNEKEKNIFSLVIHKCMESFSDVAIYDKAKYIFDNKGVEFITRTSVLIEEGWKQYSFDRFEENGDEGEINLSLNFIEGQIVPVQNFELVEIQSKPPALYTDANLTPDLTNIGKFLKEENPKLLEELKGQIDLSDVQIGTQATRPLIIERLKKMEFITLERKKYVPTDKGLKFYETIKNLKVSNIANTAILEKELKDISDGKLDDKVFYNNLNQYVTSIVNDIFGISSTLNINERKSIGNCPKCKTGKIVEGKKGYGCDQFKKGCDFVIWKEVAGKVLTQKNITDLINKGITSSIKGFKGKRGEFNAKIHLDSDFNCKFKFD